MNVLIVIQAQPMQPTSLATPGGDHSHAVAANGSYQARLSMQRDDQAQTAVAVSMDFITSAVSFGTTSSAFMFSCT